MFTFNKHQYEYFDHPSNQTRVNERRVELPIAFQFADQFKEEDILEVGNVLSHYHNKYRSHDVVDLYEQVQWRPIINESILEFTPQKHYKALVSVSTLEHTDNPLLAIEKTLSLADNVLITIPCGYGNGWSKHIPETVTCFYLKRITEDNQWQQVERNEAVNLNYNSPFKYANGIIIIQK